MASVQELILAAQSKREANKSPLVTLLESGMQGFEQGVEDRQRRIETARKMIELQQLKEQMQRQREMQEQFNAQMDAQKETDLQNKSRQAAGNAPTVTAQQKVQVEWEQDAKGNVSRKLKPGAVDKYTPREYTDASGTNRIGSYNAATGQLIQSPSDPVAPKKGGSAAYALTDAEQAALVKAAQREVNPLPISIVKTRGPAAKVLAQAFMENPDYNPTKAELDFFVEKRGAGAEASTRLGTLATIKPMADSLEDVLGYAEGYINKLSPSKLRIVNSAYQRGLAEVNDPDANALLTHLNEATALYAAVLKGGKASPTDQQFHDAKAIFRTGLSPEGFAGVTEAVKKAARSRVQHLKEPSTAGGGEGGGEKKLPVINSQEEYDALPKGTRYVDSYGKEGTKN